MIHYDEHQFAYYNLYNARDSDIYIYYLILMTKINNLGIPLNDSNFDPNKVNLLAKFNLDNPNLINDIGYVQTLISNSIKYPMLYPLNIYWINEFNYMIPYNLIDAIKNSINIGKKYIIIRINIIGETLHANILLIDLINKRILRFEPQGGININSYDYLDDILKNLFLNNQDFKEYKYFRPIDYEPINGFQSLSQETNEYNIRKGDINGFCVAWCTWWIEFYIKNIQNQLFSDNKFKMLIPKVIKKIINSNNLITEYIRNYANYMHKELINYLTKKNFNFTNLYYDKYNDSELVFIYKTINDDFLKIN
jgi:hypothetical protein